MSKSTSLPRSRKYSANAVAMNAPRILTSGGLSEVATTTTDENGEFRIPGKGLRILSNLDLMSFMIFKAGYDYEAGHWDSLKMGYGLQDRVTWEGNKPIIPLGKLSLEERREKRTPSFPAEAYKRKKIPLLIKEINKVEIELGRQPYPEK